MASVDFEVSALPLPPSLSFIFDERKVFNPLNADLVLEVVQSGAGVKGEIFAQSSHPFSSFVVPPGRTVNSGTLGNVLLTQGAIASLGIIPLGILDITAASTVRIGQGGCEVPWLKLNQRSVSTTCNLVLSTSALMAKAIGRYLQTTLRPVPVLHTPALPHPPPPPRMPGHLWPRIYPLVRLLRRTCSDQSSACVSSETHSGPGSR
jgi:hypothetical protein